MQHRQRQIADGALHAVANTRAEVSQELAFLRAVFAKLPEGRVRDQYAQHAAVTAARLGELDDELAALSAVREELASEPETIIVAGPVSPANGGV